MKCDTPMTFEEAKKRLGIVDRNPLPMTNEQWLRSLNTEELAEFLADQCNDVVDFILRETDEQAGNIEPDDYWYRKDAFVEWLNRPHT